jgi:hypothetical protein
MYYYQSSVKIGAWILSLLNIRRTTMVSVGHDLKTKVAIIWSWTSRCRRKARINDHYLQFLWMLQNSGSCVFGLRKGNPSEVVSRSIALLTHANEQGKWRRPPPIDRGHRNEGSHWRPNPVEDKTMRIGRLAN